MDSGLLIWPCFRVDTRMRDLGGLEGNHVRPKLHETGKAGFSDDETQGHHS